MSFIDFARKQFGTALRSLELLDGGQVEDFIGSLSSSEKSVFFTGVGKNGHVASKAASTFNSMGIKVVYIDPVDAVHGDLGMISEGDAVVAISKSGNTDELLCFLAQCAKRTSDIWIVHSNRGNRSVQYAGHEVYIDIDREADTLNTAPTSSIVAYVAFMQAVACEIADRKRLSLEDFVKNHPGGSIGRIKV
jgi:arabinose-5-phosphate isomerase